MIFGINTFLFTSPFTNESVSLFPRFKEWGFDSVEISVEDASHIDPVYVRQQLEANGLTCNTVCAAMGPDHDFRGNEQQQESANQYLKSLLDVIVPLGAGMLVGPLYSSVGRADAVPEDEYSRQWQTVVGHLKGIATYAQERNIKLGIEPLNRFETDFLNTVDQALKLIHEIDNPVVFLHYDTFHMNIEEKDQPKAITKAGKLLGHFHACGCDRGTPGNDHLNWEGMARALREVDYQGGVVIESFTTDVKVIAKAAAIWRKIEPSQDVIASDGVKFLRGLLG